MIAGFSRKSALTHHHRNAVSQVPAYQGAPFQGCQAEPTSASVDSHAYGQHDPVQREAPSLATHQAEHLSSAKEIRGNMGGVYVCYGVFGDGLRWIAGNYVWLVCEWRLNVSV
jgi:hypothetical protein